MSEFKTAEVPETKKTDVENYNNIKPENGTTVKEARDFTDALFKEKESTIEAIVKEYIDELKKNSECPETISESSIDITKLEKQMPDEVAKMREEFEVKKAGLIKEWEEQNDKPWPKYTEDVYSKNAYLIRKAGDNYDAHHIQLLCLGGKNEACNITPLHTNEHINIHSVDSACNEMLNRVGGSAQ